jgi:alpha-methylacyl-CoA racemase
MTDNLFPFLFWALGDGLAGGDWRGSGEHLLTGASARYRLYPCADARILAVAAIEEKFWQTFCAIVGLETRFRAQSFAAETIACVSAIVKSQPSTVWREKFAGRDCCCSVVATLQEALGNPHFFARGLMAHRLVNETGQALPALPVPVDVGFRGPASQALAAPSLGAHNREFRIGRATRPTSA